MITLPWWGLALIILLSICLGLELAKLIMDAAVQQITKNLIESRKALKRSDAQVVELDRMLAEVEAMRQTNPSPDTDHR